MISQVGGKAKKKLWPVASTGGLCAKMQSHTRVSSPHATTRGRRPNVHSTPGRIFGAAILLGKQCNRPPPRWSFARERLWNRAPIQFCPGIPRFQYGPERDDSDGASTLLLVVWVERAGQSAAVRHCRI